MLDYKLIEALATVVEAGGFEKAAFRLHLTQSAISQRIKLLEEQAGQVLLVRATPPRATRAGQQMIKHYLQVKRLEDDLFDTFTPSGEKAFVVLAVGINGDSLATWFFEAVGPFLKEERVLLDLRSDDQEQTHRLLKDGEVIGCISAKDHPMQGCRVDYLGRMDYRLLATPGFAARWFPEGLTADAVARTPVLIFNRADELHLRFFRRTLGTSSLQMPAHYLPSPEKFVDVIRSGLAYGMLPDQQSAALLETGELLELVPGKRVPVRLYWHCWNIKSRLLEAFGAHLVAATRRLLPQ